MNMKTLPVGRNTTFRAMILVGVGCFDLFNYATTEKALNDMNLGEFIGIRLAIALAIAFCAIDFAGMASIFTKHALPDEPWWVWALLGGWFIAAGINAWLTWWSISMGIVTAPAMNHPIVSPKAVLTVVPVVLAIAVYLVRILIIGSIVAAGNKHESEETKKGPEVKPIASAPTARAALKAPAMETQTIAAARAAAYRGATTATPAKTRASTVVRTGVLRTGPTAGAAQPTKVVPVPETQAPIIQPPLGTSAVDLTGFDMEQIKRLADEDNLD